MSLLREIQDAATGTDVPVNVLLRKAQVLAVRLGNEPLRQWTRLELDGYKRRDDLPDYRRLGEVLVLGTFAGPFGSGSENAPMPRHNVPSDLHEMLYTHDVFESVAQLEVLSRSPENATRYPWSPDAVALLAAQFYENMNCVQAFKVISSTQLVAILDTVRTRLLDFALEIEHLDPSAGNSTLGQTSAVPVATVTQIFNQTISGGLVAFANSGYGNVTQEISQRTEEASSWDDVQEYLRAWGLQEADLTALKNALRLDGSDADTSQELVVGERTESWIGRVATGIATGTLKLAENIGVQAIVALLTKVFGS